jgi:hypothetical protein
VCVGGARNTLFTVPNGQVIRARCAGSSIIVRSNFGTQTVSACIFRLAVPALLTSEGIVVPFRGSVAGNTVSTVGRIRRVGGTDTSHGVLIKDIGFRAA